jgi:hypothetical protein
MVMEGKLESGENEVDVAELKSGVYFFKSAGRSEVLIIQ